jgi:hypothetical protein
MSSYGTDHARSALADLATILSACELVDPEVRAWETDEAWLCEWPTIVRTLAGLVVFAHRDGTVGVGCVREVTDAIAAHLPVAAYGIGAGLVDLAGLDFLPAGERTARRVATVRLGHPVRWPWAASRLLEAETGAT